MSTDWARETAHKFFGATPGAERRYGIAQAVRPGMRYKEHASPGGAALTQNPRRVVFDATLLQQSEVFLGEVALLMMICLPIDVLDDPLHS